MRIPKTYAARVDVSTYNVEYPHASDYHSPAIDHILATNLTGTFDCIKAVAPLMRAQKRGRIVNISSGAGLVPRGSSTPACR